MPSVSLVSWKTPQFQPAVLSVPDIVGTETDRRPSSPPWNLQTPNQHNRKFCSVPCVAITETYTYLLLDLFKVTTEYLNDGVTAQEKGGGEREKGVGQG